MADEFAGKLPGDGVECFKRPINRNADLKIRNLGVDSSGLKGGVIPGEVVKPGQAFAIGIAQLVRLIGNPPTLSFELIR